MAGVRFLRRRRDLKSIAGLTLSRGNMMKPSSSAQSKDQQLKSVYSSYHQSSGLCPNGLWSPLHLIGLSHDFEKKKMSLALYLGFILCAFYDFYNI